MKIAIPLANKKLCMHFGHCQEFAIIDIENKEIVKQESFNPPPHEPGLYPRVLSEMGVDLIIAGGMGMNARNLFTQNGVQVIVGAPSDSPESIVEKFLNDTLVCGANTCDH